MILSQKEVMMLLGCSESAAASHMKKIKKQFSTQFVTKYHMADYLSIDILAFLASYYIRVMHDNVSAMKLLEARIIIFKSQQSMANKSSPEIEKELKKALLP